VEAIGVLRGLLGKKPELGDARYLLGKMLLSEGKAEEAVGELEEAARLSPEAPNVRYQLGQAYQKLGRSEQAQRQFDLFRQLKDQSQGRKP
jgi:Flp pilus assembly protein TadD